MLGWVKNIKNIQPPTLAALPWPGGALSYVKHGLQGYLIGRYYVHIFSLFCHGNVGKLIKLED